MVVQQSYHIVQDPLELVIQGPVRCYCRLGCIPVLALDERSRPHSKQIGRRLHGVIFAWCG
jgi:hypothetical protein